MRRPEMRATLAALVTLAVGGCNFYYNTLPSPDDALKLVPWFDHMIRSQAVHPYQRADVPRYTVAGTVPIDREERDWGAEWPAVTTTADALPNPTAAFAAETLAKGDTLYGVYCSMCHGPAGNQGGTVGPRIGAPSLVTELARSRTDGYLYSVIRYGRGVMWRYGDKIPRPLDRWAVVNYVRKLQADHVAAGGTD